MTDCKPRKQWLPSRSLDGQNWEMQRLIGLWASGKKDFPWLYREEALPSPQGCGHLNRKEQGQRITYKNIYDKNLQYILPSPWNKHEGSGHLQWKPYFFCSDLNLELWCKISLYKAETSICNPNSLFTRRENTYPTYTKICIFFSKRKLRH